MVNRGEVWGITRGRVCPDIPGSVFVFVLTYWIRSAAVSRLNLLLSSFVVVTPDTSAGVVASAQKGDETNNQENHQEQQQQYGFSYRTSLSLMINLHLQTTSAV